MKKVKKGFFARTKNSSFSGNNYVGNFANVYASNIGKMTYIGSNSKIIRTKVGSYCSISSNVSIVGGSHPSRTWVSTHPAFYKKDNPCGKSYSKRSLFDEYKFVDEDKLYYVEIGNDVWVGANVVILQGVVIGDGAIIGCGSVVTKNVEPYSVVVGSPAKTIRKRFNEEQIAFLEKHPYWELEDEWLEKHSHLLQNIDEYIGYFDEKTKRK